MATPKPAWLPHEIGRNVPSATLINGEEMTRSVRGPVCGAPRPRANPGTINAGDLRRLARFASPLKRRIRALLELTQGDHVLDVGCGPGVDTTAIAAQVGPGGRVVGIDYDASMIRQARSHAQKSGHAGWLTHKLASATAIPFCADSFDVCYSERLLQHTADAERVVREMIRVTAPGGRVVIADTDWATLSIDTPEVDVERALVRFVGDTLCNGYAGRQLRRLLKDGGLDDVTVAVWPIVWTDLRTFRATSLSLMDMDRRAVQAGVVSPADLKRLYESLADADRRKAFFASGGVMVARGRKTSVRTTGEQIERAGGSHECG